MGAVSPRGQGLRAAGLTRDARREKGAELCGLRATSRGARATGRRSEERQSRGDVSRRGQTGCEAGDRRHERAARRKGHGP